MGLIFPLFSLFLNSKGVHSIEIGFILTVAIIISTLTQPIWGKSSDRFNKKNLQILLTITLALAFFLTTYGNCLLDFLVSSIFIYTCTEALNSVSVALVTSLVQTGNIGRGFGQWRISISLGWIIATLFSGLLTEIFDFSAIFISSSIMSLISIFVLLSIKDDRTLEKGEKSSMSFDFIWKNHNLLKIYIAILLVWVVLPSLDSFLALYMTHPPLQVPNTLISLAFSISAIAEIPAMLYLGQLSDKIGRKLILSICFLSFPFRLFLTAVSSNIINILFAQLFSALTFGGLYVVSMAYISDVTSIEIRGSAVSFLTISMNVGNILGSAITGALIDILGFKMMYILMAFYSILPCLFFLIVIRETLPSASR